MTLSGFIDTFKLTSASVNDRKALLELVEKQKNKTILGDKGYVSKSFFFKNRYKFSFSAKIL